MLSKLYRQYPVVKDAPDTRDSVAAPVTTSANSVVTSVDLRSFCGPVKDQGQSSACTAHSASSMREFLYRKFYDQEINKSVPPAEFILSPWYLYYKERQFEGDTGQDAGASMRTAAKMLNNVGTCLLSQDPFSATSITASPTAIQVADALTYKSGSYHVITGGVEGMKSVLLSGYGFISGITVYESFEDDFTARTGVVLMPNVNKEQCLGGHAVFCVGFDDTKQCFIYQNSWGTSWGDKGFFYLPYQFAANPNLLSDSWVNHLGHAWGTPQQIGTVIQESSEASIPTPEIQPEVKSEEQHTEQ